METQSNLLKEAKLELSRLIAETNAGQIELVNTLDENADRIREGIRHLRESRMMCTAEVAASMSALRDVRAFFLDKDYEAERARLKDFVELCERLVALQKSGALDAVADVALKLAVPQAA